MSAQLVQICALFSQSHRRLSTYLPGATAGTRRVSTIRVLKGSRPEQRPVSDFLRSTVSVHGGSNVPVAVVGACCELEYGSGFIAHVDPGGVVPVDTSVALIVVNPGGVFSVALGVSAHSSLCTFVANSNGMRWKQASVSGLDAGQSLN